MTFSRWLSSSSRRYLSTALKEPSHTTFAPHSVSTSAASSSISFPLAFHKASDARLVGSWLLGTAGVVVGMIHIGGLTRLTSSGLSMTTWSPLGSLPPLTRQAWEEEFLRYQQFPEYSQRQSMTLSEFQYIYAWEYGHRMLGRFVGIVYTVPWMILTYRGVIAKKAVAVSQSRLALLGTMGGLQGLVGWWMVKSGLGDDRREDKHQIKVKPVRLMTHLSMAMMTYATLCWTAWDVLRAPSMADKTEKHVENWIRNQQPTNNNNNTTIRWMMQHLRKIRQGSLLVTGLTAFSIVTGALVAGNDGGRAYNCWPKMTDEDWIAPEVWSSSSSDDETNHKKKKTASHYICDDTATTQFHHRLLGQATGVTALSLVAYGLLSTRRGGGKLLATTTNSLLPLQVQQGLYAIGMATTAQVTLGITTLLHHVPISLAALHQLGSVLVLTSSLYTVHACQSIIKHPTIRKMVANAVVRR